MNINNLKQIVNDLETNYNLVAGSNPATADLLIMFGMSFDRWLINAVRDLGGDTSTLIRANETGLESALNDIMFVREESEYYVDYVGDLK